MSTLIDDARVHSGLVSAAEICAAFRFSESSLYRAIKSGRFPAPLVRNGRRLWSIDDVRAWELERFGRGGAA